MPASELRDPECRDATGRRVADLYCPGCDNYSGGGLCRVCQQEIAAGHRAVPSIQHTNGGKTHEL